MTQVLNWLKSNVATVIFLVVMVAALVALPIISSKLNAGVKDTVDNRIAKLREVEKLEKTKISIGNPVYGTPDEKTGLVNQRLLERYKEVTEAEAKDAEAVRRAAVAHNKKGRGVLMANIFPDPPPDKREVLPEQFSGVVGDAYRQLLVRIDAGSPPSLDSMTEQIERKRAQYRTRILAKDESQPLDADEQAKLDEHLTKNRMSLYAEAAERIKIYATIDALNVPAYAQAQQPTWAELFDWQWQYWITEDLMMALAEANRDAASVQKAPAKHVLGIWHGEHLFDAGGGATGGGGGSTGAPGLGGGEQRRGSPSAGGGSAAAPAEPPIKPNPVLEVKPQYGVSFTGRTSNPLYDVRMVDMSLVVDSARIPQVLDAIAKQNFITIIDIDVFPADHYAAAREGFFYGQEPVSQIMLKLETIWLREWTSQHMPLELKQVLRVPVESEKASG